MILDETYESGNLFQLLVQQEEEQILDQVINRPNMDINMNDTKSKQMVDNNIDNG